ncbi:hypothetical protein [Nocardia brasiliensis]|uniref:Uncharacterized protein n=1 Tax=Nocardia brasiliensis (strain ATCC 700358 / HUJEG-1) TaxID=1133849 RepID=K0F837_NOCB7|nr:hypothetical protein [Nocardia brasiliensis]AFU03631.1 hypothetical protein O3I_028410 [Nocardia brasiliensis ATCC 700358]OCF89624.1 hypothetical protein AW168_14800 [Nocardia brasiliensis]
MTKRVLHVVTNVGYYDDPLSRVGTTEPTLELADQGIELDGSIVKALGINKISHQSRCRPQDLRYFIRSGSKCAVSSWP